jgi:hypothetical protein
VVKGALFFVLEKERDWGKERKGKESKRRRKRERKANFRAALAYWTRKIYIDIYIYICVEGKSRGKIAKTKSTRFWIPKGKEERKGKESPKETVKEEGGVFERSLSHCNSRNRRVERSVDFSGGNRNPIIILLEFLVCVVCFCRCFLFGFRESMGWKTLAIFSAVRFGEGGAAFASEGSAGLEEDVDCEVGTGRRFEASHWGFRVCL